MAVKVLTWFRRTPGMSVADFRSYWRNEHPKAVTALPGLVRYNQNPVDDTAYGSFDANGNPERQPFCDGVAETWWESLDAIRSQRGSAELDALMADEERFIDPDHRGSMIVDEVVIVDGEPAADSLKQFSWLKRRPDLGIDEAHRYWRENHGPLASTVPGMVRYVQNHTGANHYRDGREPEWDGVPIVHLAGWAEAKAAGRSPQLAATRADEANFLNGEPLPFVICREIPIL